MKGFLMTPLVAIARGQILSSIFGHALIVIDRLEDGGERSLFLGRNLRPPNLE
jgi:hypothetical protein